MPRPDIEADLDAQFSTHSIGPRLHAVPPHEVYEVRVDGQRGVYKRNTGRTGNAAVEGHVLSFVGERTSVEVPETLCVGEDHYVAAWHSAAPDPDSEHEPDPGWAAAAGAGLARLHAETASDLDGYGQFHVDADGGVATAGHGDWQAGAVEYVRNYRGTLERHGHGDVLDTVLDALAGHPHLFDGVGTAVCCHGWATPEHVAVEEGQVSCMVDFEHAVAAPGEFDYWRTVFPALGGEENEDARRAFRTGYESVRALPDGLARRRPLYRLLNGVYFFESLYVQSQHDPAETERRAASLRETVDGIVTGLGEG